MNTLYIALMIVFAATLMVVGSSHTSYAATDNVVGITSGVHNASVSLVYGRHGSGRGQGWRGGNRGYWRGGYGYPRYGGYYGGYSPYYGNSYNSYGNSGTCVWTGYNYNCYNF